jgi:hypothetical protein
VSGAPGLDAPGLHVWLAMPVLLTEAPTLDVLFHALPARFCETGNSQSLALASGSFPPHDVTLPLSLWLRAFHPSNTSSFWLVRAFFSGCLLHPPPVPGAFLVAHPVGFAFPKQP